MADVEWGPDPGREVEWMADRRLELIDDAGVMHEVLVRIAKPYAVDEEQEFWYCRYDVSGGGLDETNDVLGPGDSMAAVVYALWMVGLRLGAKQRRGLPLTLFGHPDLGLPLPPPSKSAPSGWRCGHTASLVTVMRAPYQPGWLRMYGRRG